MPVDLRGDWSGALVGAGLDPRAPVAWLAEGLLPYLTAGSEQDLFDRINELSTVDSRLAVEHAYDVAGMLDHGGLGEVREGEFDLASLLHADARPGPADRLAAAGWTVTEESATAVAHRYHRDLADPRLPVTPGPRLRIAEYTALLSARRTA